MASTYTPGQAFDYVKRLIKNMPLEQVQVQILDDTNKYMWMFAPWRWSLGTVAAITLLDNTQDYTINPTPADFLYLQDAYITDSAGGVPRILYIDGYLPTGGKKGTISRCAIINPTPSGSSTFRSFPQPGVVGSNNTVVMTYKKQAPVITSSNIGTPGVLVFDDEWFNVYISGCLYYAYLFADDQRAGGASMGANGQVQFTGQRAVWEANLTLMRQRERINGMTTVAEEQKEVS